MTLFLDINSAAPGSGGPGNLGSEYTSVLAARYVTGNTSTRLEVNNFNGAGDEDLPLNHVTGGNLDHPPTNMAGIRSHWMIPLNHITTWRPEYAVILVGGNVVIDRSTTGLAGPAGAGLYRTVSINETDLAVAPSNNSPAFVKL